MDRSRPDRHARPLLPNRLGGRPTRRARPARPLSLRDGGSRAAPAARAVLSLLPVQRRHLGVRRRRLPLDARPPDTHRALARRAGATYVPTLTVVDGYGQVTARRFVPDRPALVCVDRATRAKAFATDTVALAQRAPLSLRQRLGRIVRSIAPDLGGGRRRDQGALNLKRVFDAGIPVALGTDAGNPLT